MTGKVQYVTDEQGQQVGVLLDLDAYRRLTGQISSDPELLTGLSEAELRALAESKLAPAAQARLDELLAQNKLRSLSEPEEGELDGLLEQVDQLTILKTRARYTLQQQQLPATP
ncbi:MAG: hypothetical protein H6631_17980 [Anaerolineaceae bacterium]|nr:hypothetical protein [Anaerolineaceae bacterium]MCB9101580.1 hypothetical protein [Anaerolineales bacterium]